MFQELQRQTADAHMAFLQVAEQSMKSLEAMLTLGVGSGVRAAPAAGAGLAPAACRHTGACTATGGFLR